MSLGSMLTGGLFDPFGGKEKSNGDTSGIDKVNQTLRPYVGMTDSTGKLKSQYRLDTTGSNLSGLNSRLNGINLNNDALNALRGYGLNQGDSPWAQMMLQQEGIQHGKQMGSTAAEGNAAMAKAFSSMAGHGGLSPAARLNLAKTGTRQNMMARQDVNQQSALNQLGIRTQDQSNKLDVLKQLPGMEINALQPEFQKTNMWSAMADTEAARHLDAAKANSQMLSTNNTNLNTYNFGKYQEQMKAWAADRTATAQENSGKK